MVEKGFKLPKIEKKKKENYHQLSELCSTLGTLTMINHEPIGIETYHCTTIYQNKIVIESKKRLYRKNQL